MPAVRRQIFGDHDPYAGFPVEDVQVDKQGWGSDDRLFDQIIKELEPSLIVEVGSWKGRSALRMGRAARGANPAAELVCVDTWLGSHEHWNNQAWHASLGLQNGYPTLYRTFIRNVIDEDLTDIITPLPLPAEVAYLLLRRYGARPKLVYIDGDHAHRSVRRDLELYFDLLAETGVLIGDDYPHAEGVARAVNEFVSARGLPLYSKPGKYLIDKAGIRDWSGFCGLSQVKRSQIVRMHLVRIIRRIRRRTGI